MKRNLIVAAMTFAVSAMTLTSCGPMGQTGIALPQGTGSQPTAQGSSQGNGGIAGDLLGSLLGTLIGNNVPVTEKSIQGTWVYSAPEVRFESENLLTQAGGMVAASKVEDELAAMYKKVGIVSGNAGFVFNADKSCALIIGDKTINGTYTVDTKNNELTFKSTTGLIKLNGKVYFGVNSLVVLFDADKILTVVQGLSALTGNIGGALSTASGLISQYKGMKVGMEFKKN